MSLGARMDAELSARIHCSICGDILIHLPNEISLHARRELGGRNKAEPLRGFPCPGAVLHDLRIAPEERVVLNEVDDEMVGDHSLGFKGDANGNTKERIPGGESPMVRTRIPASRSRASTARWMSSRDTRWARAPGLSSSTKTLDCVEIAQALPVLQIIHS